MAPAHSRPLTDLCIIAVFKQLKPNDQLLASQMSPRCFLLVRAANSRLRSMLITTWESAWKRERKYVDSFSLSTKPSMKLLLDRNVADGESTRHPFVDFPVNNSAAFNEWRCLKLSSFGTCLPNPKLIVPLFPSVTHLTVITCNLRHALYISMLLQHSRWAGRIASLILVEYEWLTGEIIRYLAYAINGLSALKHLALYWQVPRTEDVPDLGPVLAHLKVLGLFLNWSKVLPFLRSLERHVADGSSDCSVQVHLIKYSFSGFSLRELGEPLRRRIVRYETYSILNCDSWPLICQQLPALTSISGLSLKCSSQAEGLLSALSSLPQLVHLELEITLHQLDESVSLQMQPQKKLNSLRALDLELNITSHSQLQWISSLQWAMPHLQTIYLRDFSCRCCDARLSSYLAGSEDPNYLATRDLLRSLLHSLHLGVSLQRIIIQCGVNQSGYRFADEVFSV